MAKDLYHHDTATIPTDRARSSSPAIDYQRQQQQEAWYFALKCPMSNSNFVDPTLIPPNLDFSSASSHSSPDYSPRGRLLSVSESEPSAMGDTHNTQPSNFSDDDESNNNSAVAANAANAHATTNNEAVNSDNLSDFMEIKSEPISTDISEFLNFPPSSFDSKGHIVFDDAATAPPSDFTTTPMAINNSSFARQDPTNTMKNNTSLDVSPRYYNPDDRMTGFHHVSETSFTVNPNSPAGSFKSFTQPDISSSFGATLNNKVDFDPKDWEDTSNLKYRLIVSDLPSKSRVETQIKVKISLYPPPPESSLHLPSDTISKTKLLLPTPFTPDERTLDLDAVVVCASDPRQRVQICSGCIGRERKRASRKKVRAPAEEAKWKDGCERRVCVFNCNEVVDLSENDLGGSTSLPSKFIELPMRLACYCRHHSEKIGFRAFFTLRDYTGTVVARGCTNPIMITDDHKAQSTMVKRENGNISNSNNNNNNKVSRSGHTSPRSSSISGSSSTGLFNLVDSSTEGLPLETNGNTTFINSTGNPRKRKSTGSCTSLSSRNLSSSLAMTRLESPNNQIQPLSQQQQHDNNNNNSNNYFNSTTLNSPSIPMRTQSAENVGLLSPENIENSNSSIANGPSSNSRRRPVISPGIAYPHELGVSHASAVASGWPSVQPRPGPSVQKIIPSQGSVRGGIEVTILGTGFYPGLVAKFGDYVSLATNCWSETTIVTYLPPSSKPGPVVVSFKDVQMNDNQIFSYIDDTDRQLMELALKVVGLKMNGKLEDARNIAMRIVGGNGSSLLSNGVIPDSMPDDGGNNSGGSSASSTNNNNQSFPTNKTELESSVMKCLELVDLDESQYTANLQLVTSENQTLLHLAAGLGLERLVVELLLRNVQIDAIDNSGFTALHFAALRGHRSVVRHLLHFRADPFMRTYSGYTTMDLANEALVSLLPSNRRIFSHRRRRSSSLRTASLSSIASHWSALAGDEWEESVDEEENDQDSDDYSDTEDTLCMEAHPPLRSRIPKQQRKLAAYLTALGKNAKNSIQRLPSWENNMFPSINSVRDFFLHEKNSSMAGLSPPSYEDIFPTSSNASGEKTDDSGKMTLSEEEVLKAWEMKRKQITHDRMLFMFWIPMLLVILMFLAVRFLSLPMILNRWNTVRQHAIYYGKQYLSRQRNERLLEAM